MLFGQRNFHLPVFRRFFGGSVGERIEDFGVGSIGVRQHDMLAFGIVAVEDIAECSLFDDLLVGQVGQIIGFRRGRSAVMESVFGLGGDRDIFHTFGVVEGRGDHDRADAPLVVERVLILAVFVFCLLARGQVLGRRTADTEQASYVIDTRYREAAYIDAVPGVEELCIGIGETVTACGCRDARQISCLPFVF